VAKPSTRARAIRTQSTRRREGGFSLIEVVLAVSILGTIVIGLLAAMATGLRASADIGDSISGTNLASAQLEDILYRGYQEPPDYPLIDPPEGFVISLDNSVLDPTLRQSIRVLVSSSADVLLADITTHKYNTAFVASPPTLLFSQRDFRWYANNGLETPTTPLAVENSSYTVQTDGQVLRLRMSVEVAQLPLSAGSARFKLQYATNAEGPWQDLGSIGSTTSTWRGFDNTPTPVDGSTLAATVLTLSNVAQSYEEANPTALNPNPVAVDEFAEWDWVIQENGADTNTTYLFRMVLSDGTPFGSYTRYPVLTLPAPRTFQQEDYRWFSNQDTLFGGSPLAAEHVPLDATAHGQVYRLRMNASVDGLNLPLGTQAFKLQYSISTLGPWFDVGGIGSGETWRGYDNPSVTDGATLVSTRLSTSSDSQSYEEANPSAPNPRQMLISLNSEWDWVLEDNNAADETSYYFRMVLDDGTPLDSYVFYPQINIPGAQVLSQENYRWYENTDSTNVTIALASENITVSNVSQGTVLRLRMNLEVGISDLATSTQAFKLQYSTTTTGAWVDVGDVGSGTIWRGFNNPTPADAALLGSTVLASSDVAQSYEESNPSISNPRLVSIGQRGEWDWVVQHNGASPSTTYYFRMVKSNGAALSSYTRYPALTTEQQDFAQHDYRWYANTGALTVTSTLALENTAVSSVAQQQVLRLRMNVGVTGLDMNTSTRAFKLQYATNPGGPWTDVGPIGSTTTTWRGYDNGAIADGTTLPATVLSSSATPESYEEANPSVPNPNRVRTGERGEWDWVIQNRSLTPGTYYFRMVQSDGTPLNTYENYPEVSTVSPGFRQRDYRWYVNIDNATVVTPHAALNTSISSITPQTVLRIRVNAEITTTTLQTLAQQFKLQYATSTSGPWTDVGGIGSGEIWRGYDNPSVSDGATLATAVLSSSHVAQSYEETNPSADNPRPATAGQYAEWDWVVQNNTSPAGTYYFRMVQSDGTPFLGYSNLPTVTTIVSTEEQDSYRWYRNNDTLTPVSAYSPQNIPATSTAHGLVYRLRMNVLVSGVTLPSSARSYKLQYSTSVGGPWTDVGGIGSGEIWRGFDNPTPADGATLPGTLLTGSNVVETYEEENPSALNPNAVTDGQRAEWDWVVQDNGAADSTTYYFRLVKADGALLDGYVRYPSLTTPAARTLAQQDYRWYSNTDAVTPITALAAQNTAITSVNPLTVLRIRVNVEVAGADLLAGQQAFKLQFATNTGGPWTDVGAVGSGAVWRGFDNATPADGATLPSLLLTGSHVAESYEEANPSVSNPNQVLIGQRAEWDWVVQNNVAPAGTYSFRMVTSAGASLDSYVNYPTATTVAATLSQRDYELFANSNNLTPPLGDALTGGVENTAYSAIVHGVTYRIRMNITAAGLPVTAGLLAFKLQYATSTGGPWTDVGGIGSGSAWRGFDNASVADGATITTLRVSTSNERGSYEEANPSVANPNTIDVGEFAEWDWVVQDNGAADSTSYFFRMVRSNGDALDGYTNYPRINIPAALTLTQQDYQWWQNRNNITPNTLYAAVNTHYTSTAPNLVYRLRMNVEAGGATLLTGQETFKLQFSTGMGGPWTDVGGLGSGAIWRGFDNGTPSDGATVAAGLLLPSSTIRGTYEEENPSAPTPFDLPPANRMEWDWVIQDNGAAEITTYYFRMVRGNGSTLTSYTRYPTLTTPEALAFDQHTYRWYENIDNLTPTSPLAAENTPYGFGSAPNVYRLRMNVQVGGVNLNAGLQAFKLQFATNTSTGPWTDVGGLGSGEIWRGFDNPGTPNDGTTIGNPPLLSTSNVRETYEESNPSVLNPNAILVGQRGEWDWTLQANGVASDTTYYFRMVRANGTPFVTYTRYPAITTIPPVIASDDFESGGSSGGSGWLSAWDLQGDAAVVSLAQPHGGSYHLRLRRNTGLAYRSVNLSGTTSVRLQFWAKASSFEAGETATVSVSSDGVGYTVLKTWVDGEDDNNYYLFDYDLSSFSLTSTFWVRFQANMSAANDQFYIDDILFVGQ